MVAYLHMDAWHIKAPTNNELTKDLGLSHSEGGQSLCEPLCIVNFSLSLHVPTEPGPPY